MRQKITNYIRSGHSGLYIVSSEEARVESELRAIAGQLKYKLMAWSATAGMVDVASGQTTDAADPMDALKIFADLKTKSIALFRDFHLFIEDANPVLVRALKDQLIAARADQKALVILGCRRVLPPELERELVVVDFDLPDRETLGRVLDGICESARLAKPQGDVRDVLIDSSSGLTTMEAENAFALSVVEAKSVRPDIVSREKALTIKRNGLLEIIDARQSLDDIGGLDLLKNWLIKRKDAFSRRAVEYGLPSPKGVLITGIPGTGKSLTAKVTASVFGRPLLKLDAGKLFGSLVGQSEANLRLVIQTAEAVAPSVVWIDEIEKGFSGSQGSGATDGGTTARVFGSFISWMQERKAKVFVVATANDITRLPPEFLRKGRWDETWFVDLPNAAERECIWAIQIGRHGRKPGAYDLKELAGATDGFTGAEIEQAFIDALYMAFAENREPDNPVILKVIADTVPLSRLMADQITALRTWAKGRARPAASPVIETKCRKLAA